MCYGCPTNVLQIHYDLVATENLQDTKVTLRYIMLPFLTHTYTVCTVYGKRWWCKTLANLANQSLFRQSFTLQNFTLATENPDKDCTRAT